MNGLREISLVLMLLLVTACAPVVYQTAHRAPSRNTSVKIYPQVHPIEVTLFANNTYRGGSFYPIRLTLTDGQYVEIPLKDRRGRQSIIYAHYYQNNLHFDAHRNCQNIYGSTRYKYDSRWDKGYKYTSVNIGKDYDLSGLNLHIRSVKKVVSNENKVVKTRVLVHKQKNIQGSHSSKSDSDQTESRQNNKPNSHTVKDNSQRSGDPIKTMNVKTPPIVEKLKRYEQTKTVAIKSNKTDMVNIPATGQTKNRSNTVIKNKNQRAKETLESEPIRIEANIEQGVATKHLKKPQNHANKPVVKTNKESKGKPDDKGREGKAHNDSGYREY